VRATASTSRGRFADYIKRPSKRRWRAAEGLTKRRLDLLMADLNLMDRGVHVDAGNTDSDLASSSDG
jgi:hypothetical protein